MEYNDGGLTIPVPWDQHIKKPCHPGIVESNIESLGRKSYSCKDTTGTVRKLDRVGPVDNRPSAD